MIQQRIPARLRHCLTALATMLTIQSCQLAHICRRASRRLGSMSTCCHGQWLGGTMSWQYLLQVDHASLA